MHLEHLCLLFLQEYGDNPFIFSRSRLLLCCQQLPATPSHASTFFDLTIEHMICVGVHRKATTTSHVYQCSFLQIGPPNQVYEKNLTVETSQSIWLLSIMALPPEKILIKRKFEEEAPETLCK